MKFSVVIPMYNKQATIGRAVHSVLNQFGEQVNEVELIIINDGSSDKSLSIVNRIQKENPHQNIVLHSQKNAGVSAARNKGIELASHNLVAFLDADDSYEPYFLDEITKLISEYPQASVYGTAYRFVNARAGTKRLSRVSGLLPGKDRQLLSDFFNSTATGDLPITSSTVCVHKAALLEVGGFPVGEHMGEDQAVWSQLALTQSIAISKKVCATYFEYTRDSLMQSITPNQEMPFSQRLQKQLDSRKISTRYVNSVKNYIAGHLLDLVRRNLEINNLETAKKLISDHRGQQQFKRWVYWSVKLRFNILRDSFVKMNSEIAH